MIEQGGDAGYWDNGIHDTNGRLAENPGGSHHFIVQRGHQYARWCKLELYKGYNTDAAAGNLPLNLPDIKTDRVRHLCITDHVDHPSTSAR